MMMNAAEMADMWLRDRARSLRAAATKTERAYQAGQLKRACDHVAKAYRDAAEVLETARDSVVAATRVDREAP